MAMSLGASAKTRYGAAGSIQVVVVADAAATPPLLEAVDVVVATELVEESVVVLADSALEAPWW
jgi:hypothetical protein